LCTAYWISWVALSIDRETQGFRWYRHDVDHYIVPTSDIYGRKPYGLQ